MTPPRSHDDGRKHFGFAFNSLLLMDEVREAHLLPKKTRRAFLLVSVAMKIDEFPCPSSAVDGSE